MKDAPAKFEFSNSFEKLENVYGAVDPTDVPAVHSGGNYAAYYVVDHQPASYWDGLSPPLVDVSGGIEIQRVKYWCINASRRLIWPNATQAAPIKDYDVIVDFGSVPAMDSASSCRTMFTIKALILLTDTTRSVSPYLKTRQPQVHFQSARSSLTTQPEYQV